MSSWWFSSVEVDGGLDLSIVGHGPVTAQQLQNHPVQNFVLTVAQHSLEFNESGVVVDGGSKQVSVLFLTKNKPKFC